MRKLPPLNAVRAFEAAARHLSFTRAADELHVTQAAISHQVKTLERWCGVPLFRRVHRGIVLTEAGQAYLKATRDLLDGLADASERLRADDLAGTLVVSVLPSFATRWLVHRLGRFHRRHPALTVRIQASAARTDFDREDVDLAIRHGRPPWPGLRYDLLMREAVFPACAPTLLGGDPPLREPADLAGHTLLHDEVNPGSEIAWRDWLRIAGVHGIDVERGIHFSDGSMALQAAVQGEGVVLTRTVLAAEELAAGRLVRPFPLAVPGHYSYYLVYPESRAARPRVAAFRSWLMEEAATMAETAPA